VMDERRKFWTDSKTKVWAKYLKSTAIGIIAAGIIIGSAVGIGFLADKVSLWFLALFFPFLVLIIGTFAYWVEENNF